MKKPKNQVWRIGARRISDPKWKIVGWQLIPCFECGANSKCPIWKEVPRGKK